MVAAAALVLLAFVILWGYRQQAESASKARLAFLKQRIESVESELASLESPLAQYEATRQWQSTRFDWASELSRLSHSLSVIQNAYLLRLQLDSADGERQARIRMEGRATSVAEATKWNRILSQSSDRYSLQPQSLDASVTDPDYPTQFRWKLWFFLEPLVIRKRIWIGPKGTSLRRLIPSKHHPTFHKDS